MGMETTLFGGPPELGNVLKLANGQIGFMTIFAHPLFQNVADIIPAMGFAAEEILKNKAVWFSRAEQEKRRDMLKHDTGLGEGSISPRSQSPVAPNRRSLHGQDQKQSDGYFPSSPLRSSAITSQHRGSRPSSRGSESQSRPGTAPSPAQGQMSALPAVQNAVTTEEPRGMSSFSPGAIFRAPSETPNSLWTGSSQIKASSRFRPTGQLQIDPSRKDDYHSASVDESTTGATTSLRTSSENDDPRRPREDTVIPAVLDRGIVGAFFGFSDASNDLEDKTLNREEKVSVAEKQSQTQGALAEDAKTQERTPTSGFDFAFKPGAATENQGYGPPHHQARSSGKVSVPSTTNTAMTNPGTGAKLSPGTEATSFLSAEDEAGDDNAKEQEENEQMATGMGNFDGGGGMVDHRSRAVSVPMHMYQESSSRTLDEEMDGPAGSRRGGSGKNHVRAAETSIANGEGPYGDSPSPSRFGKGSVGGMPRRRSRLRLAFWKKRPSEEESH